jgi:hypothetical protein
VLSLLLSTVNGHFSYCCRWWSFAWEIRACRGIQFPGGGGCGRPIGVVVRDRGGGSGSRVAR